MFIRLYYIATLALRVFRSVIFDSGVSCLLVVTKCAVLDEGVHPGCVQGLGVFGHVVWWEGGVALRRWLFTISEVKIKDKFGNMRWHALIGFVNPEGVVFAIIEVE